MDAEPDTLNDEEEKLLERFAHAVVQRGLVAPAILFLESVRPLNFLASQGMLFFSPMLSALFPRQEWDVLQRLLERRASIEHIVSRIEKKDAECAAQKERPGQDGSGASSGGDK
ncbi:MAG: hypothetical protein IPK60_24255 [Sandaracinaceae bacterium]|nr:hypothetical protein [Sandaracinaceae bacterium]